MLLGSITRELTAQTNSNEYTWNKKFQGSNSFIENRGQFVSQNGTSSPIVFGVDQSHTKIYFTKKGITYTFLKAAEKNKEEEEREEEKEREMKGRISSPEEYKAFEAEENRVRYETETVNMTWEGVSDDVELIGITPTNNYHSYNVQLAGGSVRNINYIRAYEKIIYKGIYPNIDVEFSFAKQGGLKYAIILHPGADPAHIKMVYDRTVGKELDGDIHVKTKFGNLKDHAPLTFYDDNNAEIINSKFVVKGKAVGFELGTYDVTKKVIIDPWIQAPNFVSNWDCVWECEKDGAGNVYIIGGVNKMQLLKYNPAGVLQWTYNTPYDTTAWLGTFATDNAGNSYVTQGSVAQMIKVNTAGGLVWNNTSPSPMLSAEFWNITFNCDQTRLVVGGTGGAIPPLPYIYQIDVNTGNVVSSLQVTTANLFPTQEVRSICASGNGKYYFLSHDTVGYINQNFSICGPNSSAMKKASNSYALSYKCENYRYNNSGIMAIRSSGTFFYTHRGNQIDKRSLTTLGIISSAAIPGGGYAGSAVQNSGLDIDACGNVYVGSKNQVIKYDANLNVLATYPTSSAFNVYDVHVSSAGDIIACGSTGTSATAARQGYIQSIAAGACAAISFTCCDPSICIPPKKCITDPSFTLIVSTPGGSWSGTGVNASGVFSPSLAGVGTHTVVYTLACGSESVLITVSSCSLYICQTNGSLTVSGGTGPYVWSSLTTSLNCSACPFATCTFLCPGTQVSVWTATGSPVSPPTATVFPIKVKDANGTTYTIVSMATVPNCTNTCPTLTISVTSQTNVNCFGASTGSAAITSTGGVGPYTYTWVPGNLIGASQTGLAAGVFTVNVKDANSCTGTFTLSITQPTSALSVSVTAITNGNCLQNGSATVTAYGGTPGYTYTWSPSGGNSNTASNLSAGNYTVSVTDSKGCTTNTVLTITQNTTAPTFTTSVSNTLTCINTSATLAASSTIGGITFTWQPMNVNSSSVSVSAVGNYTVNITNPVNGCTNTAVVSVVQNTVIPNVSASVPGSLTCTNLSVIITGTSTTAGATYTWQPGNITTSSLSVFTAGNYTLTTTNPVNGCINSTVVTVSQNTVAPTISASVGGTLTCINLGVTLSGTSTVAGATYTWLPQNVTTASTSVSSAGNYTLVVKDPINGCTSTTVVAVSQNTVQPNISASVSGSLTCTNTVVVLTGTSTTGGVTYTWQPMNVNTSSVSVTAVGNYSLTVTNPVNGCTNTTVVAVSQNTIVPTISASVGGSLTCTTIAVVLTGTSTTGGVTYTWQPMNANTSSVSVVTVGNYSLMVTNPINGCTNATVVSVSQNTTVPNISASVGGTLTCINSSVVLTGTSTTGGVTYTWQPMNVNTSTVSVSAAGNYSLTVTNPANGCTSTTVVAVSQNTTAPNISASVGGTLTCANISVVLTGTSTTGGATYSWQPMNVNTSTVSVSAVGNYSLTVTNPANGCTSTTVVTVTQNTTAPNISASLSGSLTCTNTVVVLTGTSTNVGATYTWQPMNVNTPTVSVSAAGNYSLTVTNPVNGCTSTTVLTVIQSAGVPTITASSSNTLTCIISIVSLNANSTGNTIVWNGGPLVNATNPATVNSIGSYSATATNTISGCSTTTVIVVAQNTVAPNITINIPATLNCINASVVLTGTSTTGGVSYNWQPMNVNNATVSVSAAGNYSLTITNPINGCVSTSVVTVNQNTVSPTISASVNGTLTCGNISVILTGTSTAAGATYTWQPMNLNTSTVSVSSVGNYSLTVTDPSNGCTSNTVVSVTQNTLVPNVSALVGGTITCTIPTVVINGNSTNAGATYTWLPSNVNTSNVIVISAGNYTLNVTDPLNGCVNSTVVTVTQNGAFPNINVVTPATLTCINSTVALIGSSSTSGVTYSWIPQNVNTATAIAASAGSYTFSVFDPVNGCTSNSVVNVTQIVNTPTAVLVKSSDLSCSATTVTLTAQGGGNNYVWNGGSLVNALNPSVVNAAGNYTVTITDAISGCISNSVITVNQSSLMPNVAAIKSNDLDCNNAQVTLTGSSTSTNVNFQWVGGPASQIYNVTAPGIYTLSVTDPNTGCVVFTTIAVSSIPMFSTALSVFGQINCNGGTNGIIQITNAGGGQAPFTITNVNSSAVITNVIAFPVQINGLGASSYTIIVTDANGCSKTHVIALNDPAKLNLAIGGITDICQGQQTSLSSTVSGGSPGYTYLWTPGGVNSSTIGLAPTTTGQYTLLATDSRGCVISSTINVTVHPQPIASLNKPAVFGCNPVCNTFSLAQNQIPGYSYTWWFYNSITSTVSTLYSPTICFNTPGVYNVSVSITSPYNCSATRSYSDYVTVYSKPIANFRFTPDRASTTEPEIKFFDQSNGATTYSWYNENDQFSTDKDPTHNFYDPGKFLVSLIVSNKYCSDTISKYVSFEDELFYIPNTFTPNDDGLNDLFHPLITGYSEEGYSFMIFDRWGALLYKTHDLHDNGWNGYYKGEMSKDDVYIWKIDIKSALSGKVKHLTGHVTLLK